MDAPQRCVVITGTSGTGKTALVEALRSQGCLVFEEPTRRVLREQLAIDGPALPAKNPALFLERMFECCLDDLATAASATQGPAFFDRGIPDLIAYAQRFGVPPEPYLQAAREHRYDPTVFVLEPWPEIFVADELRRLSFAQYAAFHELIVASYERAGYRLLAVPRLSVEARAAFVLDAVAAG